MKQLFNKNFIGLVFLIIFILGVVYYSDIKAQEVIQNCPSGTHWLIGDTGPGDCVDDITTTITPTENIFPIPSNVVSSTDNYKAVAGTVFSLTSKINNPVVFDQAGSTVIKLTNDLKLVDTVFSDSADIFLKVWGTSYYDSEHPDRGFSELGPTVLDYEAKAVIEENRATAFIFDSNKNLIKTVPYLMSSGVESSSNNLLSKTIIQRWSSQFAGRLAYYGVWPVVTNKTYDLNNDVQYSNPNQTFRQRWPESDGYFATPGYIYITAFGNEHYTIPEHTMSIYNNLDLGKLAPGHYDVVVVMAPYLESKYKKCYGHYDIDGWQGDSSITYLGELPKCIPSTWGGLQPSETRTTPTQQLTVTLGFDVLDFNKKPEVLVSDIKQDSVKIKQDFPDLSKTGAIEAGFIISKNADFSSPIEIKMPSMPISGPNFIDIKSLVNNTTYYVKSYIKIDPTTMNSNGNKYTVYGDSTTFNTLPSIKVKLTVTPSQNIKKGDKIKVFWNISDFIDLNPPYYYNATYPSIKGPFCMFYVKDKTTNKVISKEQYSMYLPDPKVGYFELSPQVNTEYSMQCVDTYDKLKKLPYYNDSSVGWLINQGIYPKN
jgi:hypothetical protein